MVNNSDAALGYARRGWRVMPVWPVRDGRCLCGTACGKNAGKHPLGELVPRGVHEASRDEALVARWWARFPDANIAVATGAGSGLFVVDVDAKSRGPEALAALVADHTELPPTAAVRTANGGIHLYFAHPGGVIRNTVSTLAKGVDVRGDGGYVLAPPSTIGPLAYAWEPGPGAVLEAPAWLRDRVTGAVVTRDPLDMAAGLNGLPEGQRDVGLFRIACKLRATGVPKSVALDLVQYAARRCDPPFDERLAADKVDRAYRVYSQAYSLTDTGNAERLAERHGDTIRYANSGRWYLWDGIRWNGDAPDAVLNMAIEVTTSLLDQARAMPTDTDEQREQRDLLIRHALNTQGINRLRAMVAIAQADQSVLVSVDDMDADPMLLNCPNGVVDLRTGTLGPHNRAHLQTKVTNCAYDPTAVAPKWEAFLEDILPDPDVRAFVQRACGYSATGSVAEQAMFFLFGHGANGKSTLVRVIQSLLGDYARTATPDILMQTRSDAHPTGVADLMGARFVPAIESEENRRMAEAQVKWLTGGDRLKARYMGRDFFEFEPHMKMWLASNHRPVIFGTDHAIWRRIYLIHFMVTIPDDRRVADLDRLLVDQEGPGIMNWLARGAADWAANGLRPPDAVRAAVAEYREEMDIMGQFMRECLAPAPGRVVGANDLYAAYAGWAKLNGEQAVAQRRFSNQIMDAGHRRLRGAGNRYEWQDLSLTADGQGYVALGASGGQMLADPVLNLMRQSL